MRVRSLWCFLVALLLPAVVYGQSAPPVLIYGISDSTLVPIAVNENGELTVSGISSSGTVEISGGDGVPVCDIGACSATLARPTVEVDSATGDPVEYGTVWTLDIPFDVNFDAPGLLLRGKTAPVDQASVDDSLVAANSDQYGSLRILPSIGGVDLTATSTSLNVNLTNNTIGVEDVAESAGGNLAMIGAVVRAATSTVPAGSSATASDNATVNVDVAGLLWTRTVDPCSGSAKSFYSFDITSATTTEITPSLGGSSNFWYICALNIVTSAANNVNLVDDNSDNCASVTASLISTGLAAGDGWNFGANGGLTIGNGMGSVMKSVTSNSVLCLVTSASAELHGTFAVVAAP